MAEKLSLCMAWAFMASAPMIFFFSLRQFSHNLTALWAIWHYKRWQFCNFMSSVNATKEWPITRRKQQLMEGKQQVTDRERDKTGADDGEGADHGDRRWQHCTSIHLTCPAHHTHQPNARCLFGGLFKLQKSLIHPSVCQCLHPYCCKYIYIQLCHCHDQEDNTNLLLRENWSGWSRVKQKKTKRKSAMN